MGLMQLIVRLGLDATSYETGLKRAQSSARSFGNELTSEIGGRIASVFAPAAVVAGVEEGVRHTIEWGSRMSDLASRTGIAVEELQALEMIAKRHGANAEHVAAIYERMGKFIAKAATGGPNSEEAQVAGRLGISSGTISAGDMKTATAELATHLQNAKAITPQLEADLSKIHKNLREMIPTLRALTTENMQAARGKVLPAEFIAEMKQFHETNLSGWEKAKQVGAGWVGGMAFGFNVVKAGAEGFWAAMKDPGTTKDG